MKPVSLWFWKAVDRHGALKQGTMLASQLASLLSEMDRQQLMLLSARRCRKTLRLRWLTSDKIECIRQIALLLQAGITLSDALTLIAEQHPRPAWSALLQNIACRIGSGASFAEALRAWPQIFPPLFVALIHTGELTGKLSACCLLLAEQQEQLCTLHKKVRSALRYPAFVLLITVLVTGGMLTFVLPEFALIYQAVNAPLPPLTRALLTCAEGLRQLALPGGVVIILLSAGVLGLRRRHAGWQEREQKILLRIPLVAPLWRGRILSQIFTVLSLTQRAGIPLLQGLSATADTLVHRLWRKQTDLIITEISLGAPFWQALTPTPCFTPLCQQLIRIGEESGTLDLMLDRLAKWHTQRTLEQAEKLTARLEPLTIVTIGVIVGGLVMAMYLPIFHLGEAIG